MKSDNQSKAISTKITNATDYSGEHRAWQQRVEKEMHSQTQQQNKPDDRQDVSKTSKFSKNFQNFAFSSKKNSNTKSTNLENFVKREIEIRSQADETFYPPEANQNRVGSSTFAKRMLSQQHSPKQNQRSFIGTYGNHIKSSNKYSSEQRYQEAKNEIPRFNEDLEMTQSHKSRSVFRKALQQRNSQLQSTQKLEETYTNADDQYAPIAEYSNQRPQTSHVSRKQYSVAKPKSAAGRSSVSNVSSIKSRIVELKKQKIIEVVSKMDESDVDQLSRQLKIDTNPKILMNSVLTQENLEKLKDAQSVYSQQDFRSLTEKLNSIKPKEEQNFICQNLFRILSQIQSAWEEDEILSSVISTTHKSNSLKSVGASYYSYLTGIERQLRDEKEHRKQMEEQIRQLQKKNEEMSEYIKQKSHYTSMSQRLL
ncbi:UNKNOWN [Stylonychia lemnae]|uniref:Uncharacterized protein n=1 Tax=Stylonychia lemnae TaxID=5949 RepID=A0A078A308_STYLE|nr:UNKNOWN [Stylonychia lemnae]|eukprot:CDW76212.1 UNKNOWN [Stylonychia lemnae]